MDGYRWGSVTKRLTFSGTSFEQDRGKKIRSDLLARTMALLNNGKLTDRPAQDCVSFLLSEVSHSSTGPSYELQLDGFPTEVFLDLVDRLVRSTEKSRVTLRAFQFFPRIAQVLSRLASLPGCTALHYSRLANYTQRAT